MVRQAHHERNENPLDNPSTSGYSPHTMGNRAISMLALAALLVLPLLAQASLSDVAVRSNYQNIEDSEKDHPFNIVAVFAGRCREAPLADAKQVVNLYKTLDSNDEKSKIMKMGACYHDAHGVESVCLEDGAINPLFMKNVRGEMITISGWKTAGNYYSLQDEYIIIVKSMERLSGEGQ